jgi:hypothetical protein
MLLQHFTRRKHNAVRLVARIACEQHSGLNSRLAGKVRFRGGKCLLDILGIGNEIRNAHGRRDFAHVFKLKMLHDVFEPRGPWHNRNRVAVDVGERPDRRVFPHHDALRIVLHGGGHGNQRQTVGDSFQRAVRRTHAKLGRA